LMGELPLILSSDGALCSVRRTKDPPPPPPPL
jgi:hypothetical protein